MENRAEVDAGLITPSRFVEQYSISTTELDILDWEWSFGKFTENNSYIQDQLEYTRNGSEPGLVIIFNFETFERSPARPGSSKDVDDIVTCMTRLGFNVNPNHILTDLSKEAIFDKISEILGSDLSEVNSVLVFVLTHGDHSNILLTSTGSIVAHDLWVKFAECPTLKGKPKMFVIQACKGEEFIKYSSEPEDTPLVPLSTFSSGNIYPDMLIMYSTLEGKYSFRDSEIGSWFIQEICRNFSAYGRRDDVLSLLSRVSKCICKNYYDQRKKQFVKQVPVLVSTLSKKFYLNKNKDRHLVLTVFEKQDEMLKVIRKISTKVKSIHGGDEKKNDK